MGGGRIFARQREIMQGGEAADVRVLFQHDDARARTNRARAFVRLDLRRDQLQQRGLSRAIATDERQTITVADKNVEMAEKPMASLAETKIFEGEYRCGHGGAARTSGAPGQERVEPDAV